MPKTSVSPDKHNNQMNESSGVTQKEVVGSQHAATLR